MLDPREQRLLRQLSVFAGGSTYEAAEALCGADPDLLESLIDKSLVRVRRDDLGQPRYWMLETVRQFAAESLDISGATEQLTHAHAEYYTGLADAYDQRRFGISHPEGLAWISRESENLQTAVAWTLTSGDAASFSVAARALAGWWLVSGWAEEGLRRIETALKQRAMLTDEVILNLDVAASDLARITGRHDRALELHDEILRLGRSNDLLIAAVKADMSEILIARGKLAEAEAELLQSLALGGGPRAKASLAELELARGNLAAAEQFASEAHDGFRGGHAFNSVILEETLGEVARLRGDHERALRFFTLSARGARELNARTLAADALDGIAATHADRGNVAEADRIAGIAMALREGSGVVVGRPERSRGVTTVPSGISLEDAIEQTVGAIH